MANRFVITASLLLSCTAISAWAAPAATPMITAGTSTMTGSHTDPNRMGKLGQADVDCSQAKPIWARIKDTNNPDMVRRFINEFGDCKLHATIAQRHLAELTGGSSQQAPETAKAEEPKPKPKPKAKSESQVTRNTDSVTPPDNAPKRTLAEEVETPAKPTTIASGNACKGQAKGPLVVIRRTDVYDAPGGQLIQSLNTGAVLLQGYGIQGDYAVYKKLSFGPGQCLYARYNPDKPNVQPLHD